MSSTYTQAKLEAGGPSAVAAAGDTLGTVLTNAYDVADDSQQLIRDWVGCTMGDFGALVKSLTQEQNIDFMQLHCEMDDLVEALSGLALALRIPCDVLTKVFCRILCF